MYVGNYLGAIISHLITETTNCILKSVYLGLNSLLLKLQDPKFLGEKIGGQGCIGFL
jgi:hypothetical protein